MKAHVVKWNKTFHRQKALLNKCKTCFDHSINFFGKNISGSYYNFISTFLKKLPKHGQSYCVVWMWEKLEYIIKSTGKFFFWHNRCNIMGKLQVTSLSCFLSGKFDIIAWKVFNNKRLWWNNKKQHVF